MDWLQAVGQSVADLEEQELRNQLAMRGIDPDKALGRPAQEKEKPVVNDYRVLAAFGIGKEGA